MSKQKILLVEPLIQCEAGRAKTMQRQSLYSPRTPKWPPSDKGELFLLFPALTLLTKFVLLFELASSVAKAETGRNSRLFFSASSIEMAMLHAVSKVKLGVFSNLF